MTIRELADEFGVTAQAVRAQLNRLSISRDQTKNPDGTLSEKAENALRTHYANTLSARLAEAERELAALRDIRAQKQALQGALEAQSAQLVEAREKYAEAIQRLDKALKKQDELHNMLQTAQTTACELAATNRAVVQGLLPGKREPFQWPWKRKSQQKRGNRE